LGGSADAEATLGRLPFGTVVLIDDLDLWWERRAGGLEVVQHILDLIDRFGGRCLFVVTATTLTHGLMRELVGLDERFLASIRLDPFTAEELRDIVLVRHRSTGMGLLIDGRATQGLADWRVARFFNQLFDRTHGNVGEALQAWVAAIDEVDGEEILVVTGESPRLGPLGELGPTQHALLGALMVHRRVPPESMALMTGLGRADLDREVAALRRSGMAEESVGALTLNRYVEPDLRRHLQARGVV
jgi:hypothetical protein